MATPPRSHRGPGDSPAHSPVLLQRAVFLAGTYPAHPAARPGNRPFVRIPAGIKKGSQKAPFCWVAEWTGIEPATPGVTGRYSNRLNYHSALTCSSPLCGPGKTGVPTGIRTPVIAVKGRCPRPLDDGDIRRLVELGGIEPPD